MSKNAQEIVYEGWLTKSPPTPRKWRARWRRRWFSLRHSGELPGQFLLTYYTDRNCRKLKGVIDLDHCEQVDLGLKLVERKLKFDHVFDIRTPTRIYYLAADTENEMKSWVNCICRVCGLKCTTGEDDGHILLNGTSDVEIVEEGEAGESINLNAENETPPISPVSPSPYIPISECFSGRSPLLETQFQDFQTLLDHNIRNSYFPNDTSQFLSNDTYDLSQRTYLNCTENEFGLQFYDCPRKLTPQSSTQNRNKEDEENADKDSPLQSPTDSESVFTDDDWTHNASTELNTSRNTRPSDSSADVDLSVAQKFTKMTIDNPQNIAEVPPVAPPRPPKPSHIVPAPNYLNLSSINITPAKSNKENLEKCATGDGKVLLTDDMYDIPRSHQVETESIRGTLARRHNYNNAEPGNMDGQIFKYDISPKPGTSTTVFKYDTDEALDEPASPVSQGSACAVYLNQNSPGPLLSDNQGILMPPPIVNRGLKPKRKLSDSVSVASLNPEPSSPRFGPSIDRKLKPPPPPPLQNSTIRRPFEADDDSNRKPRAAPSPTSLARSHECLLDPCDQEQIYHFLPGSKKMQYLDLDLELSSSQFAPPDINILPSKSSESNTVYKEVDFTKTRAFNLTKNNLERERMETGPSGSVTFSKK